tara:strand:- start:900 stop:1082 length:183 start_codon:yes stop_codon:yes gene_type:complete
MESCALCSVKDSIIEDIKGELEVLKIKYSNLLLLTNADIPIYSQDATTFHESKYPAAGYD